MENKNKDITFITNEGDNTLQKRFDTLIKHTRLFDCLVGYFYSSGFYALYKYFEPVEKIRILMGLGTDKKTFELIQSAGNEKYLSHVQLKESYSSSAVSDIESSPDKKEVEEASKKFIEWIISGKLQIRVYPSQKLHAKVYIMTFREGEVEEGRIITGSSNLTEAGLKDNLEFNVALRDPSDYEFALKKFNDLWEQSTEVSKTFVESVMKKTWLNDSLKPYELYLKFLYEYFKEKINQQDLFEGFYRGEKYLDLEYQKEAVKDAKQKLEEYGGVFISDVVGLGKTYIAALLIEQLRGRTLVLAPPTLVDIDNPGSWNNVFQEFNLPATFESIGKLDKVLSRGVDDYENVIIDESHRFRSEENKTYDLLFQICRGKRVILVSATPLNNYPKDILSQIKLFQNIRNSTIPNVKNLENFFNSLQAKLNGLDRLEDREEYFRIVKENAKEIRERVLKFVMVRRTRSEIIKFFSEDLKRSGLRFPEVTNPAPAYYELNKVENDVFNRTIKLITQDFKYIRYTPLLYLREDIKILSQPEELSQKNMRKFMKILLVKRLESSFFAFSRSIERFIQYYEKFINAYNKNRVPVSKKYTDKFFEYLEEGDEDLIKGLEEVEELKEYKASDFKKEYIDLLKKDLKVLREIQNLWKKIKRDPKINKLSDLLNNGPILKRHKVILFTESRETAEYLKVNLPKNLSGQSIVFSGSSFASVREEVIKNFDANSREQKNDYRILISTEVLSEGVNLHRSNIVINYDIPWNPTRMIQRVGRVNRVNTKFDKIYIYNFFPTIQSNNQIKLKEAAESKIHAFIEMLGADARLLTNDEEINSFQLFNKLTSKKLITEEGEIEDSELEYLQEIRDIRDENPGLFEKIKSLPKKARTAKRNDDNPNSLLTYFRKGKLQKFYLAKRDTSQELDFFSAAKLIKTKIEEQRTQIGNDFYELLDLSKKEFEISTKEEPMEYGGKGGRDVATQILTRLTSSTIRSFKGFTDDDESYIENVIDRIKQGAISRYTLKRLVLKLKKESEPLRILSIIRSEIGTRIFEKTYAEQSIKNIGPREVILSIYLTGI